MPTVTPIPLPAPRAFYPYDLEPYHSHLEKIRVCALCERYYERWQAYKQAHVYRRGGLAIAAGHLEQAAYLYMMFRAHVLQCRIVAKSLGESIQAERYERYNRYTRDVQQQQQHRDWAQTTAEAGVC